MTAQSGAPPPAERRPRGRGTTKAPRVLTAPTLSAVTQRALAEGAEARSRREIAEQLARENGLGELPPLADLYTVLPGDPPDLARSLLARQRAQLVEPLDEPPPDEPADAPVSNRQRQGGDSAGTAQGHTDNPLTCTGDSGDSGDSPPRTSWSAKELMQTTFPPPRWAVPGVLPEGLTMLAGPPKIGKSWLALGLAVAVATGGKALGKIDVAAGPALYLALEDTPRRLQARLRKVLAKDSAPDNLTLTTACLALPAGGDAQIDRWLKAHPDARLVVIDVFAKVRGPVPHGSAYDADYRAVERAKKLADDHGVAVVLVHHVRKMGSVDFLDEVSGTHGIAGAADSVIVLKRTRGTADGALHITGRDVEETEHALRFDPELGAWHLLDGPAVEHLVSETRAKILAHVRAHPGARPKEIAAATALDYELVKKTAPRMADDGQLVNHGSGCYTLPGVPVPPVPAVPGAGQNVGGVSLPLSLAVPGDTDTDRALQLLANHLGAVEICP